MEQDRRRHEIEKRNYCAEPTEGSQTADRRPARAWRSRVNSWRAGFGAAQRHRYSAADRDGKQPATVQVTQWKIQVAEQGGILSFLRDSTDGVGQETVAEQEKGRLERKAGQLVVEVEWLKKCKEKCKELGIAP